MIFSAFSVLLLDLVDAGVPDGAVVDQGQNEWGVCPFGEIILKDEIAASVNSLVRNAYLRPERERHYEDVEVGGLFEEGAEDSDDDGSVVFTFAETPTLRFTFEDLEEERQDVVVKYMSECTRRVLAGKSDPTWLVHDYRVLRLLDSSGITPRVFYLSDSVRWMTGAGVDFGGAIGLALQEWIGNYMRCETGSEFRYQVMERVGTDLAVFTSNRLGRIGGPQYIADSIFLVSKTLGLVQKLHALGWVHGDIHAMNIAFKSPKFSNQQDIQAADLVLLDLEKSREISDSTPNPVTNDLALHLLSPWQLQGLPLSPRDDVIRVMYTLAGILDPDSVFDLFTRVRNLERSVEVDPQVQAKTIEYLLAVRLNERLFKESSFVKFGLPEQARAALLRDLEDIHQFVLETLLGIEGPLPDHFFEEIIHRLNSIAHSLIA